MDTKLTHSDEIWMQRCLQLAAKGLGTTYPNPMVGCVVVVDGKIIGEGWHKKAGTPHAEVHAIAAVKDKSNLKNATVYVSLEPCNHHGRTPPCVDLLIKHNVSTVVVGCLDPNPKVAGQGVERLRAAGCSVRVGVLEKACRHINRRFFTYFQKKRPYLTVKWAESKDGFLAPLPNKKQKREVYWLSNSFSQQLAHQWRAEEHAILIGKGTLKADNPSLNVRHWKGTDPIPILIDPNATLNATDKLAQRKDLIHLTASDFSIDKGNVPLPLLLEHLYNKGIQSILVEGGAFTLSQFLDQQLWDEIRIIKTQKRLEDGVPAPQVERLPFKIESLQGDAYWHFRQTD